MPKINYILYNLCSNFTQKYKIINNNGNIIDNISFHNEYIALLYL